MGKNDKDILSHDSPMSDLKNTFEFGENVKPRRRQSSHAHTLHTPQSQAKPVKNVGGSLDFLDEPQAEDEQNENLKPRT